MSCRDFKLFRSPIEHPWLWSFLAHRFSGRALNAHQREAHGAYAVEEAMEVGLIDDLPREDRLPVLGLHLHSFEGRSVSLAKFVTNHYPVDCLGAHGKLPFAATVHYALRA